MNRDRSGERPPGASPPPVTDFLEAGFSPPPWKDFEALHAELNQRLEEDRRVRDAREALLLEKGEELLEEAKSRHARIESQVHRLEVLLAGFEELGGFGRAGREEVEGHLRVAREYRELLRGFLEHPGFEEARELRDRVVRDERGRLLESLHRDRLPAEIDEAVTSILSAVDSSSSDWAREAMHAFEEDLREWRRFHHLPAVERFWREMKKRLARNYPDLAREAEEKSIELGAENERRESTRQSNEEARELALEVRAQVETLSRDALEEARVLMNVWLGRLRKYQDELDLDEGVRKEVYQAFGSVNRVRKELRVPGFIDALNRSYRTDWDDYVRLWESKLEAARAQDRADRREDRRAEERERELEIASSEELRRVSRRLEEIVEVLDELGSDEGWRDDVETREEAREFLMSGVELDGGRSEEFLRAAAPFAALCHGAELRRLRRSLAKRDVDFDTIELIAPDDPSGVDALLAELRPRWKGAQLAIVGGLPREQVRVRIAEGLQLGAVRWFEYYRNRCERESAEAAIRSGSLDLVLLLVRYAGHRIGEIKDVARSEGVEVRVIDRGCGVSAILRGLRAAGRP